MNSIAAYGSDDESVNEEGAQSRTSASVTSATKYTGSRKPTKKLEVSILPESIQAALSRGDTLNDSDSESDGEQRMRRSSANARSTGLLALLPPPTVVESAQSQYDYDSRLLEKKAPIPKASVMPEVYSSRISEYTKVEEEIEFVPSYEIRSVNTAPDVLSQSNSASTALSAAVATERRVVQEQRSSLRKREREMETHLLQGNLSVGLQGADVVSVVGGGHDWDAGEYRLKQQRESELRTIANGGKLGESAAYSMPSKLQNRRHQINSLAVNAAERELELLEAKGARNRTKAETQVRSLNISYPHLSSLLIVIIGKVWMVEREIIFVVIIILLFSAVPSLISRVFSQTFPNSIVHSYESNSPRTLQQVQKE